MSSSQKVELPKILLPFATLHKRALGVATGVVLGSLVFLATAALLLKGGEVVGPNLVLLSQYFFGYRISWLGSLIGLGWGFFLGFVLGWSFAALRNFVFRAWLALIRSRAEREQYSDLLDRL